MGLVSIEIKKKTGTCGSWRSIEEDQKCLLHTDVLVTFKDCIRELKKAATCASRIILISFFGVHGAGLDYRGRGRSALEDERLFLAKN